MTKNEYLYAFETEFHKLLENEEGRRFYAMGKWINAHMYYALGLAVEKAAQRFYDEVVADDFKTAKLEEELKQEEAEKQLEKFAEEQIEETS